ncbi:hypothetical protein SH528x_007107 [Novipirellula sp. SH528]|uniref:hypothetical protein n=1 Tax=Novipirellula sp. SH528 TaxID=3454466 RepID=UPI003FA0DFBB
MTHAERDYRPNIRKSPDLAVAIHHILYVFIGLLGPIRVPQTHGGQAAAPTQFQAIY